MTNWKFLISATLIVGAGFVTLDILQFAVLKLSEFPFGTYPIPFSNGVKEALVELPEDAHRKIAAKVADAKAWLDQAVSATPSNLKLSIA